jgi:transcriptional regulator with XRE-family HTH domain
MTKKLPVDPVEKYGDTPTGFAGDPEEPQERDDVGYKYPHLDRQQAFLRRFQLFMKSQNLTFAQIERETGIWHATLSRIRKTGMLSQKSMVALNRTYGLSPLWLMDGEGSMLFRHDHVGQFYTVPTEPPGTFLVPLLDSLDELLQKRLVLSSVRVLAVGMGMRFSKDLTGAIKMPDDSLAPVIMKDWFVGIDTSEDLRTDVNSLAGKLCAVEVEGRVMLRWVERTAFGWRLAARPWETINPTAQCQPDAPKIIGKVVFWFGSQP